MSEQGRVITYSDAGVEALREEMRRDSSIVYIGQGIGPRGGNFRQTKGLWKEFGDDRLRDTGICELGATGVAIGAAMAGTRTIVDEVFLDFALEAITQIVQQAANISYMSNGKIKAPVLVRGAMGAVRNAGAHHSHTFYNWFANTPGLKVVLPATPYDLKGLFKSSLREPGPVMFIEHKSLYNTKGVVPEEDYIIPLGEARIVREGTDLTIVAMSLLRNWRRKEFRWRSSIPEPSFLWIANVSPIPSRRPENLSSSMNLRRPAALQLSFWPLQSRTVSTKCRWFPNEFAQSQCPIPLARCWRT